jgi:hypothetical protein
MVVGDLNDSHHCYRSEVDPAIGHHRNWFLCDLDHESIISRELDAELAISIPE